MDFKMNFSSSVSFCFLFLLKASIALSAPHSPYPDEVDEETLMDKLASLAGSLGPQGPFDLTTNYLSAAGVHSGGPTNNELSLTQTRGLTYGAPEDAFVGGRNVVPKLPREFGYKPTDIRFYLNADQFPPAPPPPQHRQPQQPQLEEELPPQRTEEKQLPPQNLLPQGEGEHIPLHQIEGQHEFVMGDDKSDFYFMKKKEQMRDTGNIGGGGGDSYSSSVRSYVPGPSHIMASDHSANYPGFTSSQMTDKPFSYSDMYYIAIVAGCSAAAVVGLIAAGICWYRIHERIKAAADVDYPAYGVTGPSKDITPSGGGDRKLAQSAQMYHYQHQKQQMAALQKGAIPGDRQGSGGSDVESDDDNEDGDYTVYECPGLAPAGEMEVKNPLFHDEQPTPATPSNGANKQQQSQQQQQQQQQASSQDSGSSSAAESASSSASSTATVTSSTPKILSESPKTPPPQLAQPQEQQQPPASGESKESKQGKGDKK